SASESNFFMKIKSRQPAHSSPEPRAMSKNRQRSGALKRPLPSGMFRTIEVRARSSCPWTAADLGTRSSIVSAQAAMSESGSHLTIKQFENVCHAVSLRTIPFQAQFIPSNIRRHHSVVVHGRFSRQFQ